MKWCWWLLESNSINANAIQFPTLSTGQIFPTFFPDMHKVWKSFKKVSLHILASEASYVYLQFEFSCPKSALNIFWQMRHFGVIFTHYEIAPIKVGVIFRPLYSSEHWTNIYNRLPPITNTHPQYGPIKNPLRFTTFSWPWYFGDTNEAVIVLLHRPCTCAPVHQPSDFSLAKFRHVRKHTEARVSFVSEKYAV